MNWLSWRRAEELLDGGDHGPDVDERLRRDRLDVLGGHALADHALHVREADADLVLDQLTDGPHPAVPEVVDVVGVVVGVVVVQLHQVGDGGEDVGLGERNSLSLGGFRSKRSRPSFGYSSVSFFVTLCRPTLAMS